MNFVQESKLPVDIAIVAFENYKGYTRGLRSDYSSHAHKLYRDMFQTPFVDVHHSSISWSELKVGAYCKLSRILTRPYRHEQGAS